MQGYTFRLFEQNPSFINGIAQILDLSNGDSKYRLNDSGYAADIEAINADWMAVGADMQLAINEYEQEAQESKFITTKS